jgi:hypothetical protein
MSELELALNRIGRDLDYPETPDLAGSVRGRLAEGRRPRAWRRPLVIALAALLVGVGAVMAVPPARSAILDWLGIGSVTIRYVEDLPDVRLATGDLGIGEKVSQEEADERVSFEIRVPTIEGLDDPDVYFRDDVGQVSFLYGSVEKPKLLITQVEARGALEKLLAGGTSVERVTTDDAFGVWIEGEQHYLFYPGATEEEPFRLVGNTLILERDDGVTLRIEADISKAEALHIARSMR